MTDGTKKLLLGVAIGAAAVTFMKTETFRKGGSKIVAGGLQLKNDAKEFIETLKEDAEDEAAEKKANA